MYPAYRLFSKLTHQLQRTSLVTIDRSVVKDESREKLNSNRRYEYFARALCKNRIVRANIHHDFTIYKRRKHRNETVLLSRDDSLRKKKLDRTGSLASTRGISRNETPAPARDRCLDVPGNENNGRNLLFAEVKP